MSLLILLAIPLVVAAVGLAVSRGKVNWIEALIQAALGVLLVGGGYLAARYVKTADTEIWNGRVAVKEHGTQGCCHNYQCFCTESCSGVGKSRTCTMICQTCYEHDHDLYWSARTTNGETIFYDACNSPSTTTPAEWEQIVEGEPTAVEHNYINYIKGAPGKFFRQPQLLERYRGGLPEYPRVHGYRAQRFIMAAAGEAVPDLARLDRRLSEINGSLGRAKQVNIIVVVTTERSEEYADALSEYWLGGKKNDLIVVIGMGSYSIGWVRIISWTDAEKVKRAIEKRIRALGNFDGYRILSVVGQEVWSKFRRKHMSDFKYLIKETEPPVWTFVLLVVLGMAISIGLQVWFWLNDPFGKDRVHEKDRRS